jgi:inorganic pyrophosphatase
VIAVNVEQDELLCAVPVESYDAPEIPTLSEVQKNQADLKTLPSR